MKGIVIYEDFRGKEVVEAIKLGEVVYNCKIGSSDDAWTNELSGIRKESTQAYCNESDTYDFETGALIALMKMCGSDKVVRACNEAFSYEEDLHELRRENKILREQRKELHKKIDELIEENKKLISDKDFSWKYYQRNIQKKQDRINELNNIEEGYIKLREEYDSLFEEKEKLQHEYNLCLNSENALKCTVDLLNKSVDKLNKAIYGYKNDLYNTAKRCKALEAENEKLKLDCEMLQHGYNDTDNVPSGHWDGDVLDIVFLPGRACGKQYTALVGLFKKIDQKKVDEAYKEAYNTTLPVWQKEVLRQAFEIRKESKEKPDLPRTLDINGTVYRKSIQIKDFGEEITKLTVDSLIEQSRDFRQKCVDEWIKPLTKREEMWGKIFALHKKNDVVIVVEKEDVNAFLHEIENRIPEIRWASWQKIFEAKGTIKDIYGALKTCGRIYFRLRKENKLSYSSNPDIYQYKDLEHISYLPPMRWDLFKKGRLAVKVNYDNCKEFYEACEKELGRRPLTMFPCMYTVSICKKDGLFEILTMTDQKKTGRKIVDWEDVR